MSIDMDDAKQCQRKQNDNLTPEIAGNTLEGWQMIKINIWQFSTQCPNFERPKRHNSAEKDKSLALKLHFLKNQINCIHFGDIDSGRRTNCRR